MQELKPMPHSEGSRGYSRRLPYRPASPRTFSSRALIMLYAGTSLFLGPLANPQAASFHSTAAGSETQTLRPSQTARKVHQVPDRTSRPSRASRTVQRRARTRQEATARTTFQAANGFVLTLSGDQSSAVVTAISPWNETLTFHLRTMQESAIEMAFGKTSLRSWFPPGSDMVDQVEVSSPLGHALQTSIQRQTRRMEVQGFAPPDFLNMETEGYTLLVNSALEEASTDFWQGLAGAFDDLEAQLPSVIHAGCFTKGLACAGGLLAYGASVAALIAACGGTLGAGCVAALLFHEAAGPTTIAVCVEFAECLR